MPIVKWLLVWYASITSITSRTATRIITWINYLLLALISRGNMIPFKISRSVANWNLNIEYKLPGIRSFHYWNIQGLILLSEMIGQQFFFYTNSWKDKQFPIYLSRLAIHFWSRLESFSFQIFRNACCQLPYYFHYLIYVVLSLNLSHIGFPSNTRQVNLRFFMPSKSFSYFNCM